VILTRNFALISYYSMIPKSGYRFSDKIMLKTKNLDRDPIQQDWIMV